MGFRERLLRGLDTPLARLNPSGTAAAQPRHARQGHEREIDAIQVIAQVKHLRKTGSRELFFVPRAVLVLRVQQELDSSLDGGRLSFAGGTEAENGPRGLRGRRRTLPPRLWVVVAAGRLSPPAAVLLVTLQP